MRRLSVAALLLTAACYGYRPGTLPRADAPDRSLGPYSRVTLTSGAVHRLANATVEGDSVIGYDEFSRARVAVAVRDVQLVEVWTGSSRKSFAAIAGTVLLVSAVALTALLWVLFSALPD
ncbi:MAG TPA: hypothetical protein VFV33_00325 [Gemmatimonadaceae bacterium]|nr:hypothetical protein [Gemmatimonadaceae bacterium]